jgi:hypothetical protein
MNDRIKALEQQCWSHRVDGVLVDGHLHFDTAKFAELIIKECCDMLSKELIIHDGYGYNQNKLHRRLKEHFGVKE